ncbi:hypothetical protein CLV84_2997 [Neolewinella xylanilytica]|uniref:Lipoprotein n=1 Tax=Neolewinella xylanilytica TaxID=1514080 RepID=A0A2S6I4J8_9BACT|nr:hypothetical protein [Neolewinella xylanilytica]PPK86080.1 hypothetical protein CLV84_2997 [Neolewinella xylanilytica]
MLKATATIVLALLVFTCMESGDPPTDNLYRPYQDAYDDAETPPEADRRFTAGEFVGLITPGMPVAQIENRYGSGVMESRKLPAGEGTTEPGYVLFPGTVDELFILLGEDKQPDRVRFSNPRANWHDAATGLTIGTEFHDLREMNGAPFEFSGFGWDYAGTVVDWHGGKLEDLIVRLTYAPERLVGGGLPDSLLGDMRLSSDSAAVQGLGLRVREIIVPIREED